MFQSLKCSWQTAPYTKGTFSFSSFTSSLPLPPMARSQKFQLDPSFSTGKNMVSCKFIVPIIKLNIKNTYSYRCSLHIYPRAPFCSCFEAAQNSVRRHRRRSIVGVWFPFYMYAFICAHDPFPAWLPCSSNEVSHLLRELQQYCEIITHLWVSTTQIRRGRKPKTGGSYANTIVRRCSWRPT